MIICLATPQDLPKLKILFVQTIQTVCVHDYTPEQLKAWTASVENTQRWEDIMAQIVLVARQDDQLLGFGVLRHDYVDMLYVHRDFQRQGVACQLYQAMEEIARQHGQTVLYSDVSKTARPFFEKKGFEVIREQTVVRHQVELTNYQMSKKIDFHTNHQIMAQSSHCIKG